jgi:acyl-CoA thioester hydrolase
MAGVQQNITYKRELYAGDLIEIRSRLVTIAVRKVVFVHELSNAERDELCAVCELTAVHMSRQTRRAVPFPADVRSRAEALISAPCRP